MGVRSLWKMAMKKRKNFNCLLDCLVTRWKLKKVERFRVYTIHLQDISTDDKKMTTRQADNRKSDRELGAELYSGYWWPDCQACESVPKR